MEEQNNRDQHIASEKALEYWNSVDLYIGGSEHATGHLLYSRFWTKFLNDRGVLPVDEPFKKLINQGMILGESAFVHKINCCYYNKPLYNDDERYFDQETSFIENKLISFDKLKGKKVEDSIAGEKYKLTEIFSKEELIDESSNSKFDFDGIYFTVSKLHVPVSDVDLKNQIILNQFIDFYRQDISEDLRFRNASGKFEVSREVEKMSKSKFNVVNPDDVCEEYGADSLRLYEMFLGPLEQAKPWSTAGLSGVHNFLKKLWKLYHDEDQFSVSEESASKEALKTLHKTIKKVTQDIEDFSFNTSVSTFMICVNELSQQKCNSREILEPLAVLISPYAPHIAEELWERLGHSGSISEVQYPLFDEKYLKEDSKTYPISFNGKMRFTMDLSLDLSKDELEEIVMADERTQKQLDGRTPKKVIIVPGKIVNIVG
jgi:leucyl-tRNA synthetase